MKGRNVPAAKASDDQGYSQYRRVYNYWIDQDDDQTWYEGTPQPTKPYITLNAEPTEGLERLGDRQEFFIPYDQIDEVIELLLHSKHDHSAPPHWKKVNDTRELTEAGLQSGVTGILE